MSLTTKQSELQKVNNEVLNCPVCKRLAKGKIVPGEGSANAKVMFIGEAPGKEEIKTGRPFVGRAGKLLRELIVISGLKSEDVFITSAVKYLPKTYITPRPADITHGRLHLNAQLNIIKPKIIVMLGNTAAVALMNEKFSISEKHGTIIKQDKKTYFLSYHPAAPLYTPKLREVIFKDFKKLKRLIT
jgi:uracil-DNA glycosylase family 4